MLEKDGTFVVFSILVKSDFRPMLQEGWKGSGKWKIRRGGNRGFVGRSFSQFVHFGERFAELRTVW